MGIQRKKEGENQEGKEGTKAKAHTARYPVDVTIHDASLGVSFPCHG
jgi:hypothetical protein